MLVYVSRWIEPGGTTTREVRHHGGCLTEDDARRLLTECIENGRVTVPGRYVVARPDSCGLNGFEFSVARPAALVVE